MRKIGIKIKILAIVFSVIVSLTTFSYFNAKGIGVSFIKATQYPVEIENISFIPYFNDNIAQPPVLRMATWLIKFCPKNKICCFPVEVYISFWGEIKLTNPTEFKKVTKNLKKLKL